MEAFVVNLSALRANGGSDSASVYLGGRKRFMAWGSVTMVDSLTVFDSDNAFAFDIFTIDGNPTTSQVFGGPKWGPQGDTNNVFEGAHVGEGYIVEFWLRTKFADDLDVFGVGIVVTLD